jgi:hypothetical protein
MIASRKLAVVVRPRGKPFRAKHRSHGPCSYAGDAYDHMGAGRFVGLLDHRNFSAALGGPYGFALTVRSQLMLLRLVKPTQQPACPTGTGAEIAMQSSAVIRSRPAAPNRESGARVGGFACLKQWSCRIAPLFAILFGEYDRRIGPRGTSSDFKRWPPYASDARVKAYAGPWRLRSHMTGVRSSLTLHRDDR